ncbi:Ig-like domain-containing protein [Hymenobacter sp. 5516J-16]|uniref:Ig-like domain-containing protein n=1 Tax=Hymenobacter sp. 5516J-16 TaxID=2932253 RepID=UPI001FD5E294|nr:Ig-like domain-containing protein [Hymenobacter sp. 5516J-16]UOQ76946.1 Ig-like domain-containing protein [Hymenobacter sp. 5516J-16]
MIIPLRAFGNLDWATLEQALMFAGDAPGAAADFYFDNVYYNTQPVVVAPVTYCGTAASGDYSWKAVTSGSNVAFTFHPLGATAGGNLAIVYVNGPGYLMTKNSAGDFTYTVPNQTSGTVLNVYFTYQVGAGGFERNSAATPHAYTVGASCGAAPVNAAPTVALTSPTATSFSAPATITLTATAADTDGSISRVEFYQGTTLLGSDATAPFSFTWNNVSAGAYSLTAKAFDDKNLSTTSAVVAITVVIPDADNDGYPADQDCDDNNAAVHPGLVFYADADGDGFGNAGAPTVTACATPAGYTLRAGDCNDQNAAINPAAQDVCGQDRNCDGKLDLPAQVAPTVAVQPSSSVQTGGPATTIYLGYGAQRVQLTASAAAAASYTWSPAAGLSASTGASVVFTPTAPGRYTFTVTARNAAGCTADASVTITVIDARGLKHSDKVLVCHQGQVLEISANAVAAHLSHSDKLGSCSAVAARPATAGVASSPSTLMTTDLTLSPNPAQDRVSLEVALGQDATYSLAIYDLKGTLVKTISSGQSAAGQRLSLEWNAADYAEGIYLVRLVTEKEVINKRLVIQH